MADSFYPVYFREEQKFRQPVLWIIIGTATGFSFWSAVQGVMAIIERTGKFDATSGGINLAVFIAIALINLLVIGLFFSARLSSEVRPDGLIIKFFPFHFRWKTIPLGNVDTIEAVTYSALKEYGGWGIRAGYKKKAYNVSGNEGVRITYSDDHHILIGSGQRNELLAALKKVWSPESRLPN